MRRILRPMLPDRIQSYLDRQQARTTAQNVEKTWKSARQTRSMNTVMKTLQSMMGLRERCMYCVDSHGCDIEHFWPKSPYPEKSFQWTNMLLCCTECGRLKGDRFPLAESEPLLVNPAEENPWLYLDFDPDTGNVTARYDVASDSFSSKGDATVRILRLNRRESLSEGNRRTYLRLVDYVQKALEQSDLDTSNFVEQLRQADDHGLLGWCFTGTGTRLEPFVTLREKVPEVWAACVAAAQ